MGYVHYYSRNITTPDPSDAYGRLAIDAMRIVSEAQAQGIRICGWHGAGEPEFTEAFFQFNGWDGVEGLSIVGERESCETFRWDAVPTIGEFDDRERIAQTGMIDGWVKTQARPYDAAVCAVLIRAKVHYGAHVWVGSDGCWGEPHPEEWAKATWLPGRALYEATFGEPAPCPFSL